MIVTTTEVEAAVHVDTEMGSRLSLNSLLLSIMKYWCSGDVTRKRLFEYSLSAATEWAFNRLIL